MTKLRRFIVVGATTILGITGAAGVSVTTAHAATATQAAPMVSPSWGGGGGWDNRGGRGGWDNRGGRCDWGCDRGGDNRDRRDNRGDCRDWDRDGRCRDWR
jgi:hypothetical protein